MRRTPSPTTPRTAGLYHTAFLMPTRADLARWLLHAAQKRVPLTGASDHAVSEAIYLDDPEGNGIEVYRDRPADEWVWQDGMVKMTTAALDLDDLARAAGNEGFSGAPDGLRVGHIHLRVGDIDQAEKFYHDVIGLDVIRRRGGATFMSSGRYHHHVGSNVWHSAGAGMRDPNRAGLAWFAFEAADTARIRRRGRAARSGGRCVRGGHPRAWSRPTPGARRCGSNAPEPQEARPPAIVAPSQPAVPALPRRDGASSRPPAWRGPGPRPVRPTSAKNLSSPAPRPSPAAAQARRRRAEIRARRSEIGPTSRMSRLTMPRAGRPVIRLVTAVLSSPAVFSASRWTGEIFASGAHRYALPICTPAAPSANAAAMPRASVIAPAAITGTADRIDHLRHQREGAGLGGEIVGQEHAAMTAGFAALRDDGIGSRDRPASAPPRRSSPN